MKFALCFTNFGPYHIARLRALAARLRSRGAQLIAYELAGSEQRYPWRQDRCDEPFEWHTLVPEVALEAALPGECRAAMIEALERNQPDAVGCVGYVRPESMAAARWARRHRLPVVLMSESQQVDRPRIWWKELVKKRRLRSFDTALVGGPTHRDYLVQLGLSPARITCGYNAVDNEFFTKSAATVRLHPDGRAGLPRAPYFLTVCRFAPEKNLFRLIDAFAHYRAQCEPSTAWDLVLCGDGPLASQIVDRVAQARCTHAVHFPGFLQSDVLPRWYAHAGAFVLPSISEPWGLVVNEAAACSLPLIVSARAGVAPVLVPQPEGTSGTQFDPFDVEALARKLAWIAVQSDEQRSAMGRRAFEIVSRWGPDRFAQGALEALDLAVLLRRRANRNGLSITESETRS